MQELSRANEGKTQAERALEEEAATVQHDLEERIMANEERAQSLENKLRESDIKTFAFHSSLSESQADYRKGHDIMDGLVTLETGFFDKGVLQTILPRGSKNLCFETLRK